MFEKSVAKPSLVDNNFYLKPKAVDSRIEVVDDRNKPLNVDLDLVNAVEKANGNMLAVDYGNCSVHDSKFLEPVFVSPSKVLYRCSSFSEGSYSRI